MGISKEIQFIKLTIIILVMLICFSPTFFVTPFPADFPLAKPNCIAQSQCGNISIPYPFGTTQDCNYQHPNFWVTCDQTSNPPKLFMQNSTIEISNISPDGQLKLLQYISHDCYNQSGTRISYNNPYISLPLYFPVNNTVNKFTILGCDTHGYINGRRQNRYYATGCTAMCYAQDDLEQGSCTGVGCCQTSIPEDVWEVNLTMGSYNNNTNVWGFNDCNYAFLVEDGAFTFSPENFTNLRNVEELPMVVDWAIHNKTCEDAGAINSLSTYACKGLNSECYEPSNGSSSYRCRCKPGYQGNPYLDDGCQDINECIDSKLNNCTENEYCANTVGGFHCKCKKGYKKGGPGQGCVHGQSLAYRLAAGLALGVIVILLVICLIYLELKRRSSNEDKKKNFLQNGGTLLQEKLKQIERNTARLIFSLTELRKATNNFHDSMIIGQGGFGTVYKGIIENKIVAIKQSKEVSSNQVDQFVNEIVVLSQINHKNVVKLLGCCLEGQVPLLVYEFISNGTLYEHLHCKHPKTTNDDFLNWDRRLSIAVETAGVLSYLHTDAFTTIIHRDVKSSNILLDNNFTAKVSDFGASKLVPLDQPHLTITVQGTFGYLDPEYMETGQLTEKSDVYSFGAVLVELLTGMRVVSRNRPEEEKNFVMFFLSKLRGKCLFDVLDDGIVCEENKEQLIQVANLAQLCLSRKGKDRPTMKQVAMELGGLKRDIKHPWAPENEHNYKSQEMEYLLDDGSNSKDDYGNSTSTGYDTSRGHIILPMNDAR